jgi:hypothetical protein
MKSLFSRATSFLASLSAAACIEGGTVETGGGGSVAEGGSVADGGAGGAPSWGGIAPTGGSVPMEPCGCVLGDGPYCAGRVEQEAAEHGCTTPFLEGHADDLMRCEGDAWTVLEDCAATCAFDGANEELNDACEVPECECFVQVAYCGTGAKKVADEMGCQIPLLPEHNGDILYCPNGEWDVKQTCELGCVEAPQGTPDYCKSDSEYLLPFNCDATKTCSSGNHTSNHDGKDEYAYDFATAVNTTIRAMRSGTVLRVRNVSPPGSACFDGGGSSCANYANTVEVKHSDGTVALYMHLSEGTVSAGEPIAQGDVVGKSGNSGWSTGPHVHVQVQEDCGIWWCQSMPFKFEEDSTISSGTSVTSQNDCP